MKIIPFIFLSLFPANSTDAQNNGTVYESKSLYSNILKMDRKYSVCLPAPMKTGPRMFMHDI
jgi:hypothetical protein